MRKDTGAKRIGDLTTARREMKAIVSNYVNGDGTSSLVKVELEAVIRRFEVEIVDLMEEGGAVTEKKPRKAKAQAAAAPVQAGKANK